MTATTEGQVVTRLLNEQRRIRRRYVAHMLTHDGYSREQANRLAFLTWLVGTGRLDGDTGAAS